MLDRTVSIVNLPKRICNDELLYRLIFAKQGKTRVLLSFDLGYLILKRVSRLDAFSVYLNRTPLLCRATGVTTDAQLVRSSRSSRTKDKPSQVSYAHDG